MSCFEVYPSTCWGFFSKYECWVTDLIIPGNGRSHGGVGGGGGGGLCFCLALGFMKTKKKKDELGDAYIYIYIYMPHVFLPHN
jgi:hypothetical protein